MKVILNYLRRPLEVSSATASTALNSATCFEPYERGDGYCFRPPLTLFLTPLAPRRPRDGELLFLARAVQNATKSVARPLFRHF